MSSITILTTVTDIAPNYGLISLINNISFSLPASPLLTQFRDIPPSKLCNSCDQQFCECTYLIKIPLGSVVEILMVNTRKFLFKNSKVCFVRKTAISMFKMAMFLKIQIFVVDF